MSKRTPNGFRKWSGRKKVLFAAIAIVLAVVLAFALDCRMVLQYYNMDAPEITKPDAVDGPDNATFGLRFSTSCAIL